MKKIEWTSLKKEYLIIAAVIGIMLMIIGKSGSLFSVDSANEDKSNDEMETFSLYSEKGDMESISEYLSYMTLNMEKCLADMEGVGEAKVFLTIENQEGTYAKSSLPKVEGVLIVAEGASNPEIVSEITQSCEALFSLKAHKIKVVRMKEGS